MENMSLIQALLSTQTPLLPWPGLERVYLALSWGAVLAALASMSLRHSRAAAHPGLRWLPLLLGLWCLLPGPASPAYWLGLAFRAPSPLSALLCAWLVVSRNGLAPGWPAPLQAVRAWAPLWAGLGWILLLDVFAVWPFSLYAWGFAPITLGLLALLGLLPWLISGAAGLSALWTVALLLHVLLRLPSGNAWDALLDPWLWLLLQADWGWRRLRRR